MTNTEQARYNMIEQQIRPWEVLDQRVLDVIAQTPREDFVPERYRALAFADIRIPLGHGQVMMNPNVEGRLLQALSLLPSDDVLEIGTGSGYVTACLARLGRQVTSIDIFAEFTETARDRLAGYGLRNLQLRTGDALGDPATVDDGKLYDAIAVTGSMPVLPPEWQQRLKPGGRLFVITGQAPIMEAWLITRTGDQEWTRESLFDTELPPLLHTHHTPAFEF